MVGRQKRETSATVLNYFYALGEAAVALVAWLSKSWVVIQLVVSAPPAVFILYYWWVHALLCELHATCRIEAPVKSSDAVSLGEWLPTFRTIVMPSS
jgi:hypothetical protein